MPAIGLFIVVLIGLSGAVGYFLGARTVTRTETAAMLGTEARQQVAALRHLVEQLKDIAWDHREIDPNLATIVIDEIRTFEKKELGP